MAEPDAEGAPPTTDLTGSAVDLRAVWGRLVGVLARGARLADPSLAEDAVQHAMLQAVRTWPLVGMPETPVAWLTTVARNHLLDALRVRRHDVAWDAPAESVAGTPVAAAVVGAETGAAAVALDELDAVESPPPTPALTGELTDDELALMFACCDPELPLASQVALALKVVCGFSLAEIVAGLLTDEAALAQRLARARRTLAARGRAIELPAGPELARRRDAVLHTLHLLFNEGYAASHGEQAQRADLCREAIRLARAVAAHPATAHADCDALAALLLLLGARLGTRVDEAGDWLLLEEQDRAAWDGRLIAAGLAHLERAQRAEQLSAWHLRAGIASEHVVAPSFAQTRWGEIAALYAALLEIEPSPGARLAWLVARGEHEGGAAVLPLVEALLPQLPPTALAYGHAAHARCLLACGQRQVALQAFDEALAAATHPAARRLLQRQRARAAA